MNKKLLLMTGLVALAAVEVNAEIKLTTPAEGETVSLINPLMRAYLDLPSSQRKDHRKTLSEEQRKAYKKAKGPLSVEFAWEGDPNGVYQFSVVRQPDGRVFYSVTVTGCTTKVRGRLEVAREWSWQVSDGKDTAKGTFKTEDRAPRIIALEGVRNVRDFGGWIGLNGRRVKQGLIIRSEGLNQNAKSTYYTYEEILELHKQGKLATAGVGKHASDLAKEYTRNLDRGNGVDKNFLRLIKEGPKEPGKLRITAADKDYLLNDLGIKSDIDMREDWETFGMTFSPLGSTVNWYHYPVFTGYWGFVTPVGRAVQAMLFSVLVNESNYPIICHCIGGTDRTGSFAYLVKGLLGVCEEDLMRDYELSFIAGGGVDDRHNDWFYKMVEAVRALPGDTLADKMKGYYLSLGFTEEQIEDFRERMLEK